MKKLSFLIAIPILIGCILTGCDGRRYELVIQVDQLIDSPNSEWKEDHGNFYYKLPNGAIRVKSDGAVSLITDLATDKQSMLLVSYPDGTRAAKVAKRFGINKLTREAIDSSSSIQAELMKDAIVAISNSMKSSVVFENPDGIKE